MNQWAVKFCKLASRESKDRRQSGLNATQVVQVCSVVSTYCGPGLTRLPGLLVAARIKSIRRCHLEDSTAEGICGVKRHLELRGRGEKQRSSASDVFHLPYSSCSEVSTHTHAPHPTPYTWPHHDLIPVTCCWDRDQPALPTGKSAAFFFFLFFFLTNAPCSRTGQRAPQTDTYLNPLDMFVRQNSRTTQENANLLQ